MIGSTIVFIPKLPENRTNIFDKIINQNLFETVELDALTLIDFAIITNQGNTNWERDDNPTFLDEENGAVLLHISENGLKAVIDFKGNLDNVDLEIQQSDIALLMDFVGKFGYDKLYDCVTF